MAGGEEVLQAQQAGAHLAAAYDRLTESQRTAFDLVKLEGLSHAKAASVLGTSVTGIKLRVHRACLILRGALRAADAPVRGRAADLAGRRTLATTHTAGARR